MPTRDPSGAAVERLQSRLKAATERFNLRFPLGPYKMELTPAEMRRQISRLTPDERIELTRQVGEDEMLRRMSGNVER